MWHLEAFVLRRTFLFVCLSFVLFEILAIRPIVLSAQSTESLQDLKEKIARLTDAQRLTEALPLLQELVSREPSNADAYYFLGFAWMAEASNVRDEAARKTLRIRAREAWMKAKELGSRRDILDGLIATIPADGSTTRSFSENIEAHAAMTEAEAFFGQGKLQDALRNYQRALQADPKLYEAALFSGDVYNQERDWAEAEKWYQKAMEIDPYREIAYRYSATPLMRQGKLDEALSRYVQSYITEPYSRFAQSGLLQWASAAKVTPAHPAIEFPIQVIGAGTAEPKVATNPAFVDKPDDGTSAWLSYGPARVDWAKKKFAEAFPQEKNYRHSLAEEAAALRAVLKTAKEINPKELHPSLAKLKKLDDDGLLEAYILMARPDEGIAQDHADYLRKNPDRLRRYVMDVVLASRN